MLIIRINPDKYSKKNLSKDKKQNTQVLTELSDN